MLRIFSRAPCRALCQSSDLLKSLRVPHESIIAVSVCRSRLYSGSRICFNKPSILEEKLQEGLANKFKNPDVPTDAQGRLIVYEGLLSLQIMKLKFFSLSTSLMGVCMQPVIWSKLAESSLGANIAAFTMTGFFTFVTPVLIHSLAKKYVTEIYYMPDTDSYSAATYNFFNRKKEILFKIEDVVVPDVPGPFSTILLEQNEKNNTKKTPLFVEPKSFNDPVHYGRIMGFDKPINYHLETEVEEVLKKKAASSKEN